MKFYLVALVLWVLPGCGQIVAANMVEADAGRDATGSDVDARETPIDVIDASSCGPYFARTTTSGNPRVRPSLCVASSEPNLQIEWYQHWHGGNYFAPCEARSGRVGGYDGETAVSVTFNAGALGGSSRRQVGISLYTTYRPRPGASPEPRCFWGSDGCSVEQLPTSDFRVVMEAVLTAPCELRFISQRSLRDEECGESVMLESLQVRARPYTSHVVYGMDAGTPPDAPSCL